MTEYGERNVSRTEVGGDVYTLIADVYRMDEVEPYTIYTLITRDGTITYNTDTGILDLGDREIEITIREYQGNMEAVNSRSTNASRPTSIDHGYTFKSKWTYVRSSWIEVEADEVIKDLTMEGLYLVLNSAVPGLGDFTSQAIDIYEYYTVYRPMDSAFGLRRYEYGDTQVLSQFRILATQGYTCDYVQIPGAVSAITSELA